MKQLMLMSVVAGRALLAVGVANAQVSEGNFRLLVATGGQADCAVSQA